MLSGALTCAAAASTLAGSQLAMVVQVVHPAEVCQLVAEHTAQTVYTVLVDVVLKRAA